MLARAKNNLQFLHGPLLLTLPNGNTYIAMAFAGSGNSGRKQIIRLSINYRILHPNMPSQTTFFLQINKTSKNILSYVSKTTQSVSMVS